jgi:endonuclease/exonuclease/phosphatase family metal-dependent hydrolase
MEREELLRRALWAGGLLVGGLGWLAVASALVAWLALRLADRHWIGTLMEFGPRYMLLAPVVMVAICAAFWRPRALLPLTTAGAIVAGPVMGLCLPVRFGWQRKTGGSVLRVLTCNTWEGRADWQLSAMIEREQPDVVALQEWPVDQPLPDGIVGGWNVVREQGLVLASRWPIVASEAVESPLGWKRTLGVRGELQLKSGRAQLFVLHLTTPREGLEAVLAHGSEGLPAVEEVTAKRKVEAAAVGKCLRKYTGPVLVVGDFNMTPESVIYRSQFGYLQNAFSAAGWGWGATKFTRFHGVRIDHILADAGWNFVRCTVGPDVGSDHRPVIADLEFCGAVRTVVMKNVPPDTAVAGNLAPAVKSLTADGISELARFGAGHE